ncbi:MAG TPA: hypothetical protein VMS17_20720 [Gemmataceae bacterium]|nr:hypothetical protein [Gemmataceae bacterium]
MFKRIWAPALCLALGAVGLLRADPPVTADPNQTYAVTPDLGPWMICATYFSGPTAPELARQMALQIRTQHNAPAYVFDYAEQERQREQELLAQMHRDMPAEAPQDGSDRVVPIPRHHPTIHVEEQCAVLIGGFPDEEAAHKYLLGVKKWNPPQLQVANGEPFEWIAYDRDKEVKLNPFEKMSMVVRNPSMANDAAARDPSKDKFLWTLNADEEYSMLRCPGKFTLAVKEYVLASKVKVAQGQAQPTIGLKPFNLFGNHNPEDESVAVAAQDAHELANTLEKALGKTGIKAYVLHTRTSSVVSIGAFNAQDDPAIQVMSQELARWLQAIAARSPDPTKKDPLGLFPSPILIPVPHPDH